MLASTLPGDVMNNAEFTVQLGALAPPMREHIVREIRAAVAEAQAAGLSQTIVDIGVNRSSMLRAVIYFRQNVSSDEADIDNGAGEAFLHAWCLGEREAYRRTMAAISSPEAKGREVDVVAAIMQGASIEEALQHTEPAAAKTNVVALRPQMARED